MMEEVIQQFQQGDLVRNKDQANRSQGRVGRFKSFWPWYFAEGEQGQEQGQHQGCDVHYLGLRGPYDYLYTGQRVEDLVLVRKAKKR